MAHKGPPSESHLEIEVFRANSPMMHKAFMLRFQLALMHACADQKKKVLLQMKEALEGGADEPSSARGHASANMASTDSNARHPWFSANFAANSGIRSAHPTR